jgi:hypothetical protein
MFIASFFALLTIRRKKGGNKFISMINLCLYGARSDNGTVDCTENKSNYSPFQIPMVRPSHVWDGSHESAGLRCLPKCSVPEVGMMPAMMFKLASVSNIKATSCQKENNAQEHRCFLQNSEIHLHHLLSN